MKSLAKFNIFGMAPVPWSAPTVTRKGNTFRDPRLEDWQAYVKLVASDHALPEPPSGPILLHLTFVHRTPPGKRECQLWSQRVEYNPELGKWTKRGEATPDLTNLVKAVEDGLAGLFWHDDVQVSESRATRLYGPREGVVVRISEIEPGDYPGLGDPVAV